MLLLSWSSYYQLQVYSSDFQSCRINWNFICKFAELPTQLMAIFLDSHKFLCRFIFIACQELYVWTKVLMKPFLFACALVFPVDCCINRVCWSFTTKGMRSVGQDEIVILLECFPDEQTLPADMFLHLHSIYQQASQGWKIPSCICMYQSINTVLEEFWPGPPWGRELNICTNLLLTWFYWGIEYVFGCY